MIVDLLKRMLPIPEPLIVEVFVNVLFVGVGFEIVFGILLFS